MQRLLAAAPADEGEGGGSSSSSSAAEPVLLFCRLPGEPYVCCGRLSYVSHVPRRQPLKFVWRLLDEPRLRGKEAWQLGSADGGRIEGVSHWNEALGC